MLLGSRRCAGLRPVAGGPMTQSGRTRLRASWGGGGAELVGVGISACRRSQGRVDEADRADGDGREA
jgi:hypothetical protein